MLAIWKIGAVEVNANPMMRHRELQHILNVCSSPLLCSPYLLTLSKDSESKVLITLESLYEEVAKDVLFNTSVSYVVRLSTINALVQSPPSDYNFRIGLCEARKLEQLQRTVL